MTRRVPVSDWNVTGNFFDVLKIIFDVVDDSDVVAIHYLTNATGRGVAILSLF